MKTGTRVLVATLLTVILLCVGFTGGFLVSRATSTAAVASVTVPSLGTASETSATLGEKVETVDKMLQKGALDPPTEASATAGAITGLLESTGDKYAAYLDPKHLGYFNEQMSGSYGGVGIGLGEKSGAAYVVEVFPGTPAAKAGVKRGDVFKTINGVTRAKWTTDDVIKLVRGPKGTSVSVTVYRPSTKKNVTFKLTREDIKYPNIKTELKGDVGYIAMYEFNATSAKDLAAAMKKLEKQGAKGFVLDLRNNPGGLLEQAVDVSSLFVKDGVIVRVDERDKKPVDYRATGNVVTKAPLVVLVNENSASAAEITAGALQDYARAKLVGTKTFGKGSVQTIEDLPFGGAVKFTTAHYLTPKGRAINGKGLTPDVVVKMDVEKMADAKTDTQLQRALKVVQSEIK
jgi:carboxyl-terminal processing protease